MDRDLHLEFIALNPPEAERVCMNYKKIGSSGNCVDKAPPLEKGGEGGFKGN